MPGIGFLQHGREVSGGGRGGRAARDNTIRNRAGPLLALGAAILRVVPILPPYFLSQPLARPSAFAPHTSGYAPSALPARPGPVPHPPSLVVARLPFFL